MRGFELVKGETDTSLLPQRATKTSAGYDFKAAEDVTILPDNIALVKTNIKAFMMDDEVLYLFDRSSNPSKKGLVLVNSVGVIDSDYYGNESNDGNIMFQFKNITENPVHIAKHERIGQGVFMKFLVTNDDNATGTRTGGIGSTDPS